MRRLLLSVCRWSAGRERGHALPSTVTDTEDSGGGSLSGAIDPARAADGPDTITFDLARCHRGITLTSGRRR